MHLHVPSEWKRLSHTDSFHFPYFPVVNNANITVQVSCASCRDGPLSFLMGIGRCFIERTRDRKKLKGGWGVGGGEGKDLIPRPNEQIVGTIHGDVARDRLRTCLLRWAGSTSSDPAAAGGDGAVERWIFVASTRLLATLRTYSNRLAGCVGTSHNVPILFSTRLVRRTSRRLLGTPFPNLKPVNEGNPNTFHTLLHPMAIAATVTSFPLNRLTPSAFV